MIPIILDKCPHLTAVGLDGVFDPSEPNMLSRSQVGRNIPFAAENPTEEPKTRLNLDVLPYYTLIGQMGIGNLLWECSPPRTVVDDPSSRLRYANALYPIKSAQWPIAHARGTENLIGWYALRETAEGLTTDNFGNFTNANGNIITKQRYFIREGTRSRIENAQPFSIHWNGLSMEVQNATTGILVKTASTDLILALSQGRVSFTGPASLECVEGRFDQDHWIPERPVPTQKEGTAFVVQSDAPNVFAIKIIPQK